MGKIAFIAPFEEILEVGQKVIKELRLEDQVKCYLGIHGDGVEIAHTLTNSGIDVIISRGGTAELIAKSGVQIPIVEIPITVQDLAEALIKAKRITGLQNPKIALMAFKNMIQSVEVFTRVMEIQLKIYRMDSDEEIPGTVERALKEKPDVLIGGIISTQIASEQRIKTLTLISGEDSFRTAFQQAEKLAYVRRHEKERMEKFRILVDYSKQGIISINSQKNIEVFNNTAAQLFGCSALEAVGKNIEWVCPSLPVDQCLEQGAELHGELLKINNKKVIANIIPINIGEVVTGAMITIEDVGQIVEMEAAIRKGIYNKGLTAKYQLNDIRGISPQIMESKRIAEEYASIDATVLIIGRSGTGKELFAQGIHNCSKRKHRPFVAVNCGAIPSSLLESELFGYVEGAFSGANKKGKAGYFELAHGGTIFLDEIGEMDKMAQTSLLRVIQERRIMRLGDDKYLPVDVRIIAATNKNLFQLVNEDSFREDLFYRINVLPLELPALKDRVGDAVYIAEHFVTVYNQMFGRSAKLSKQAKEYLNNYSWPGNIRQLRNVIERLVLISRDGDISGELMGSLLEASIEKTIVQTNNEDNDLSERSRILRALAESNYNQNNAAKRLGIDRSTLYRKLKALKIEVKKVCNT